MIRQCTKLVIRCLLSHEYLVNIFTYLNDNVTKNLILLPIKKRRFCLIINFIAAKYYTKCINMIHIVPYVVSFFFFGITLICGYIKGDSKWIITNMQSYTLLHVITYFYMFFFSTFRKLGFWDHINQEHGLVLLHLHLVWKSTQNKFEIMYSHKIVCFYDVSRNITI